MAYRKGMQVWTNLRRVSVFLFIFVSVILIATKLLMDFDAFGPGNPRAFLLSLISFVVAVALGIVWLAKRQFIIGGTLLALSLLVISFPDIIDEKYWRFNFNKSRYLSLIQDDRSPHPKFKIFNWGNKNTSLGGGFIIEGIVYDESDEVGKLPEARSSEWQQRRSNPLPDDRWVTDMPSIYPPCRMDARPLGEHFYYLAKEC